MMIACSVDKPQDELPGILVGLRLRAGLGWAGPAIIQRNPDRAYEDVMPLPGLPALAALTQVGHFFLKSWNTSMPTPPKICADGADVKPVLRSVVETACALINNESLSPSRL